MPGNDDIEIQVSMELAKALSDLKNLEQNINETKKSIDSNLSPSVDNAGTKITGFGGKVTQAGQKIKSAIGTEAALAFTALSAGITAFTKQCIDGAMQSEAAWRRFGSLVNSNGGNWAEEESSIKSWAKTFSNEVGRSVGDTREASMTFLEMGMSSKQLDGAMRATAGVAARAGMTEAEASEVVRSALLGKGKQLEKFTGLRIDDYKNAQGQIDKERLLNDLYNQNKGAIEDYANSTEGQIQKINNSWNTFKTSIGQALLPVVKIIAQVVGAVVKWFANLPGPAKTVIAILLLVVGAISTVIGVLGMLAPGLIALGELIGGLGGVIAFITGPIGIAIIAIVALAGILYYLYETNEDVRNALNGFAEWLQSVFATVWQNLVTVFNQLVASLQPLGAAFGDLVSAVQEFWMALTGTDASGTATDFNTLAAIGDVLKTVLLVLANTLGSELSVAFQVVVAVVQGLVQVLTILFQISTQIILTFQTLFNAITAGISSIQLVIQNIRNIFATVVAIIRARLLQAWTIASNFATMIQQVITSRLTGLLSRVGSIFSSIVSRIRSRLANAVSAARQKAVEIYNNIVNKIKEIPQAVSDEIGKIPGKIQSGLASAAASALTGAQNIVSSFLSGLQRHSPGKIQRETIAEFSALPGIVTSQGVLTAKATGNAARGIVGAWTDNMETLGVNMDSVIPQFNALSTGIGVDLGIVGANMNTNGITPPTPTMTTNNNTNHNGHTTVYQVDHMTIDLNNLETDEREQWYRMLQTVTRGV